MSKPRAKCGTQSGYVSHYYHGEVPCDDCREAQRNYKKAWNARKRAEAKS